MIEARPDPDELERRALEQALRDAPHEPGPERLYTSAWRSAGLLESTTGVAPEPGRPRAGSEARRPSAG